MAGRSSGRSRSDGTRTVIFECVGPVSPTVASTTTTTTVVPPPGMRYTYRSDQELIQASQTAAALWTPGGGNTFVLTGGFLSVTAAGSFRVFDNSDAAGNMLMEGTFSAGDQIPLAAIIGQPWESGSADNVLAYTSGPGFAGEITLSGYEF